MTTKSLNGVELMQAGVEANNLRFTADDLQGIADAHRALGLDGKVPLKFGHNDTQPMTDGKPALGWASNVRVVDGKLLADFTDLPELVYASIKTGRYKNVSVELLKNVQAGTRIIPWVLDGIALLGADQPAFGNLADLQALAMTHAMPRLKHESRAHFTLQADPVAALRAENAVLMARVNQQSVENAIELHIASGQCLPAAREAFKRLFKLQSPADWARVELSDWHQFARTQPKGIQPRSPTSFAADSGTQSGGAGDTPDVQLVQLIDAEVTKSGGKVTDFEARRAAMAVIFRRDQTFAQRYFNNQDW